jgi:undecaprenyl-diphosphatase
MNFIQSIFLGFVQGLTEFIPVSSSAHLVIMQNILGIKEPQIFFDIVLHLGTLCAVILYFYKDILDIAKSLFDFSSEGFKMAVFLVIATIPTGIGGFLFEDYFEKVFSLPVFTSLFLVITGIVLFLTKFKLNNSKTIQNFSYLDAILIGIAQTIAIAPGISRSGMTISAGIFRGLDRKLCAKFSLLLSIPAILGAALSEMKDIKICEIGNPGNIFIGFLTAFLVGYGAIILLVKILEKARFYIFSYYCWVVGSLSFLYFCFC